MPTLGTIGTSLYAWQSHSGDTSTAREMWKFGRPSHTALAYSAILQLSTSFAVSNSAWIASTGHTPTQRPQPVHFALRMVHLPFSMRGAPCAQFLMHLPQPMQRS